MSKVVDLRKYTRGPWNVNTQKGNDVLGSYEYSRIEDAKGTPLIGEWRPKTKCPALAVFRANVSLVAAAQDLVRELAKSILVCYNQGLSEYNHSLGDTFRYNKSAFDAIAKALQCKPEDLTLENLRIVAEVE